jgi:hypothetical protein
MKLNIEWGPEASQKMAWNEAVDWCNLLGDGWRLPTIGELRRAYEQDVAGFAPDSYWSSSEEYDYSGKWHHYFYFGTQYDYSKHLPKRVRACRDVAEPREAK